MMTWLWSMSGVLLHGAGDLLALGALRELIEGVLGDEQRGRADDVGHAGVRRGQDRDAREVAERQRNADLLLGQDDEDRAPAEPVGQELRGLLGRRRVEAGRVQDRDRPALGVDRERAAQRGAALLAVDLERVLARLGAEDDAAAGPDRRARRAGAGAPGALLTPRLRAAAGDQAAGLGGRGALAARVELRAHGLVDERAVEAGAEGDVVEGDLLRAAEDGGVSHRCEPPRRRCGARAPSRGP